MKNTLLIIAAIIISIGSQAQIRKGKMMLSGSVNYSNRSTRTDTGGILGLQPPNNSTSFTGIIRYGYFVTNKIMVGVYGGYSYSGSNSKYTYFDGTNTIIQTANYTGNNFLGGAFSRYYQMLGKSRFALFGQLSMGYSTGKQEQTSISQTVGGNLNTSDSHSDLSSIGVSVNPGLVFFVTKYIAIETSFGSAGYSAQRMRNNNAGGKYNETTSSVFTTNLGLSISNLTWGVSFYFGGKKDKAETPGK